VAGLTCLSRITLRLGATTVLLLALTLPAVARAAETVIPLAGEVPEGDPDHFLVEFEVPEGIVEIEVRHDDLSANNILDWGLLDPETSRGWGGGNGEPAIVGIDAASRSYVAGPIPAGTWSVVVGKAKIETTPAQYDIEVVLRDTPTLAPQSDRGEYAPAAPIDERPGWYAGDFHAHSSESGDARVSMDDAAALATSRGLDFIHLAEHNTTSQLQFYTAVQARHPDLLLVPGAEYTTYDGHALAIGATEWVDHKVGLDGVTAEQAVDDYHGQGAVFAPAHPVLELGTICIGCAWKQDVPGEKLDAIEIATGGLDKAGGIFTDDAIAYWDELLDTGVHVAAIGGSDDHKGGEDLGPFDSPIGDATTMVYAESLSADAIVEAVRNGRTVVKLQGPDDPLIELWSADELDGDTVRAQSTTLDIVVTGAQGQHLRLVTDGVAGKLVDVTADPFEYAVDVEAPDAGERRYRAELFVDGSRRVVTSHVWLTAEGAPPAGGTDGGGTDGSGGAGDGGGGCSCRASGAAAGPWAAPLSLLVAFFGLLGPGRRMRRRD